MSDLQRRDQKSCSALIGYASPLLHMTPCDVVDVKVELRTKGISLQVQVVLIFAVDNPNMSAGNVTKLHTFAKHRTNRNDLMHFDCITAC